MKRVKIWVKLLLYYLFSLKCNWRAKLLSAEKTVELVEKKKCSLIRLGDGELNILDGGAVHYQIADENLKTEMGQLIEHYMSDPEGCEYVLCMPNEFLKCNGLRLVKRRVWVASWARFRYVFMRNFDRPIVYGDAFLFAKAYEKAYEKLWKAAENVVFVHNGEKYAAYFADKYKKNVSFVKVPARDSYEQIDEIVAEIEKAATDAKLKGPTIVLISAGPCAKAVVYRLRNTDVQVIDTGHCWDDPLHLM